MQNSDTNRWADRPQFTPDFIVSLKPDEVFVFGSNLAGAHAGGAARTAYKNFGAVWGKGVGHYGQTYAIPTMQGGVDTIKPYVDDFIAYAKSHSELLFYVTPYRMRYCRICRTANCAAICRSHRRRKHPLAKVICRILLNQNRHQMANYGFATHAQIQ